MTRKKPETIEQMMEEAAKENIRSIRGGRVANGGGGVKGTPIDYSTPEMQKKIREENKKKYGFDPNDDFPSYGGRKK